MSQRDQKPAQGCTELCKNRGKLINPDYGERIYDYYGMGLGGPV